MGVGLSSSLKTSEKSFSSFSLGNHNYADGRPFNCAEFTVVKYAESDPLSFADWYSTSPTTKQDSLIYSDTGSKIAQACWLADRQTRQFWSVLLGHVL